MRTIKSAKDLIDKHGSTHSLRTLDALQLAACISEKEKSPLFVCADSNLNKLSKLEGIQALNPEAEGTSPSTLKIEN